MKRIERAAVAGGLAAIVGLGSPGHALAVGDAPAVVLPLPS